VPADSSRARDASARISSPSATQRLSTNRFHSSVCCLLKATIDLLRKRGFASFVNAVAVVRGFRHSGRPLRPRTPPVCPPFALPD